MKVIVASFQYEACCFSDMLPGEADFEYFTGEDIFKKLVVREQLLEAGIQVIPAIYANALPGGKLPLSLYERYLGEILSVVRQHPDADGLFFYFHGSMEVERVGSGELALLRQVRKVTGEKPLIALALDLHANITDDLPRLADIVCGYKTAPHTDQAETQLRAVRCLIDNLKAGTRPATVSVPLPMLPMGDAMLTAEEPLSSLVAETIEIEARKEGVVNLFFGHMWIDAPNTHASVVATAATKEEAARLAQAFARKFWDTRFSYRLNVENGPLEEGADLALAAEERRFFLSDSGDNTTAGAAGDRLDAALAFLRRAPAKRVCVAGITDKNLVASAGALTTGAEVPFFAGGTIYPATLVAKGKILGWAGEIVGDSVTLRVGNVDMIFTEKRSAFTSEEHFASAGADLASYRVVVVKLGYLFSALRPWCDRHYFALTDGGSCVDIRRHAYRKLKRPMFPLDSDATFHI